MWYAEERERRSCPPVSGLGGFAKPIIGFCLCRLSQLGVVLSRILFITAHY